MENTTAYIQTLIAEGYEPKAPDRETANINASALRESGNCQECDKSPMAFHPFTHPETRSFRALAICPNCNYSFEF